ncbi:angio-associated migratory cell protein [Phtheirospermum japonicum]|uniref:Angio-associated migratory cell protein n=1 Tax=Phtheirospermum japonicum TaxID=374723 RepID=A0A830CMV9_9LAMI|nr:angio-associated migratory cell protein [Phtheirospermum japonicum]
MNVSPPNHEEDNGEEDFLDESDIINEYDVDEEELPDADEEGGSDGEEDFDGADDSIHIFTGHTGELYTAACSPTDATLVATGGGDDKGFLWRISQGDWAFELQVCCAMKWVLILEELIVSKASVTVSILNVSIVIGSTGHQDSVSSLCFSADGQLLASGSLDGVVKVWDIAKGELKCTLEGPSGGIEWVRWHPKGHLVLAGSEDSSVWMWNADKASYMNVFTGHGSSVSCGDFTPDGKTICSGSDDATMRIWNPATAENIHVVRGHPYHTAGLTCLTINSDSTLALSGSSDGSAHVVNISTGKVVSSLSAHSDSVECAAFEASARRGSWRAATGGMDKKLIIWDMDSSPRCICDHEGSECESKSFGSGVMFKKLKLLQYYNGRPQTASFWDVKVAKCAS